MSALLKESRVNKQIFRAIGLMSGTSADGIDVALVEIRTNPLKVSLNAFHVYPYPENLKKRIFKAFSPKTSLLEIGELNVLIAEAFSKAALSLLQKQKLNSKQIDFIGSHGQTIYHQPPSATRKSAVPFTMQLGDGSVIAQRTGILTVSDFRMADVAQGGEGAPLAPYVDWRLFSHPTKGRVFLNLGGIANFTYLPPKGKIDQIIACDTGPANVILDSFAYDEGGRLAARGQVNPALLKQLLALPYLRKPLPKSADRQWFGKEFVSSLRRQYQKLNPADFLATFCAFIAESVAIHLQRYASSASEIFVSGGGVHNHTLMRFLRSATKMQFHKFDVLGIPAKAKEAVAFAFLAFETLQGRPSNVPKVTGARYPCVLGKISLGREKPWKRL